MKGKLRVGLLIILMLGVMGICTVKTYAVSSPYMSLNTTQDVITHDNAILHARLINTGIEITGFEISVYQNNELVKSGFKANTDSSSVINIVFDLKKDLSIVLSPNTTYTYTISAKAEEDINLSMYQQSFHFTTTAAATEVTTEETDHIVQEKPSEIVRTKTPGRVKLKSVKNRKRKTVVIKYRRVRNAKKYQIQYAKNSKFKKAVIRNTKKLTFTIRKLKKGKKYYIRVRGVNGEKKGKWSKVKKVIIKK